LKKILHIIDNFSEGAGAETILYGTINELKGYQNYLIYFHEPDGLLKKLHNNTEVHYFSVKSKLDLIRAVFFIRKFVKENNIDAIHAHLVESIIVVKLARIKSIPVFITYHSIFMERYRYRFLPNAFYLSHLVSYKKNQVSIAVTNAVIKKLQRKFNIRDNMYCLYNFVDNKFLQASVNTTESGISSGKTKIICVGNIRPEKNFELIFDAFERELKNYPDIELDIWGANRMRNNFKEQLSANGVKNLHLKGASFEIEKILSGYDLFVSTSKFESFGISVLEAMAKGVPVLISDIPAFQEVYKEHATFFNPDSTNDFIDKLKWVLRNNETVKEKAKKAIPYAKSFTIDSFIENLTTIYSRHLEA
jgi:glycosyltransferase involved in cell wall biosynthesis